jgi:hypothetical protein
MGGVDRADQMQSHFGGFAAQGHFKKWYKKTLLAVLDCMLHNARLMWNMSVDSDYGRAHGRKAMERYEFMHLVAQELLTFKTESLVSPARKQSASRGPARSEELPGGPATQSAESSTTQPIGGGSVGAAAGSVGAAAASTKALPNTWHRCVVCQLELSLVRTAIRNYEKKHKVEVAKADRCRLVNSISEGCRKELSTCICCPMEKDGGGLAPHSKPLLTTGKKKIHTMFSNGMSCMDIYHSEVGYEIWKRRATGDKTAKRFSCTAARNHHYIHELRKLVEAEVAESLTDTT